MLILVQSWIHLSCLAQKEAMTTITGEKAFNAKLQQYQLPFTSFVCRDIV